MKKINPLIPTELCLPRASERARDANEYANIARGLKEGYQSLVAKLAGWQNIMQDSPVILCVCVFFISGAVEIIISWSMYNELQSGILSQSNPFISVFMGLAVVLTGAVVSHLIGKRFSSNLVKLEEYNLLFESKAPVPLSVIEENIRRKSRRQFIFGILLGAGLLVGVYIISTQRVGYMSIIAGQKFGWFQQLLPVGVVLVEIACGIFLVYFFKQMMLKRKISAMQKQFKKAKNACAYETQMCQEYYELATQHQDPGTVSRDIRITLYRYAHRALDADDYVDEIPEIRRVNAMVVIDGVPQQKAHIYGQVTTQNFTNAVYTDAEGKALLEWYGDDDFLSGICIAGIYYPGPYKCYTHVVIDLGHSMKTA